MKILNPYLMFNGNCEDAFLFYKSVFGGEFELLSRYETMPEHKDFPISDEQKNNIMHVSLPISEHSCLMGADDIQNQQNTGSNITISINLEDDKEADRLFTELSEKGKIVMPLERKFWGDYYGMLVDQFGVSWMLNSNTQS